MCNQNCHYPSNINNVLSQLSIQYCITIQAVKLIIIYLVLVMNGHSGNSAMHCLWLALTGFVSPCMIIPTCVSSISIFVCELLTRYDRLNITPLTQYTDPTSRFSPQFPAPIYSVIRFESIISPGSYLITDNDWYEQLTNLYSKESRYES